MRNWWIGAGLLATAAWPGVAFASDKPIYAPAPTWVKPAPPIDAATFSDATPALVRADNQQRLENGQVWSYFDTATRPASAQQLSAVGDVKLDWQPSQGDLIIHTAEIVRGDKHIDLVNGKTPFTVLRREAQLDQRVLDGLLTATMATEGLAVGDVLHIAFSVTRRDPTLKGDVQALAGLVTEPMRLGYGRVRLSWPAKDDVRWRVYADRVAAKPTVVAGYRELEIALPLAKPAELPDDAPLRYRKLPLVEASSFADWAAVSKAMAPLYATDGLIATGSPLAGEVARIAAASADPLVRAAAALRLVQDQVRYLLLGMDTGNYVPQPPALTWERRYGDCKAKTLLLLAVLHKLGIAAEPVAANLGLGELVPERLPSLAAFNHVLVRATIAGKTYWLDGTGAGTRLADLGDTPRLGSVLPLRAAGATLLPVTPSPETRPDVTVAVDLDDRAVDVPTLAKVAITLRGAMAEQISAAASQASPKERADVVRKIIADQVGSGNYIDTAVSYDAASATATLSAVGLAGTRWQRRENRYRLVLDAAVGKLSFDPDRARTAWSAIPAALPGPSSIVYRTTLHLPEGGSGYTLEGDETLPAQLAGSVLKRTVTRVGGTVTLEDRVDQVGGEVAAADIPVQKAAVAQAGNRLLTVLAPASGVGDSFYWMRARQSGALKPIDAMFARVVADDPTNVAVYDWQSRFHEGGGDRAGAVADTTHALAVEPSVDRYLRRAALYAALGNQKAQLADLEAARKLDPANDDAMSSLASYRAAHGDAAGAVAMVEERLARAGAKDRVTWMGAKADVQADAGLGDAALATLDAAIVEKPGNADLLNQRCWVRGTTNKMLNGALKDCTKAIELTDDPGAALDSRAMVYYRLGRFDDALADLGAALESSPDYAASRYMRGIVRHRMGKKADGDSDLAAARQLDPQIDKDYMRWGILP